MDILQHIATRHISDQNQQRTSKNKPYKYNCQKQARHNLEIMNLSSQLGLPTSLLGGVCIMSYALSCARGDMVNWLCGVLDPCAMQTSDAGHFGDTWSCLFLGGMHLHFWPFKAFSIENMMINTINHGSAWGPASPGSRAPCVFFFGFFADAKFKMNGSKWLNQAMIDIGEKDGEGISND